MTCRMGLRPTFHPSIGGLPLRPQLLHEGSYSQSRRTAGGVLLLARSPHFDPDGAMTRDPQGVGVAPPASKISCSLVVVLIEEVDGLTVTALLLFSLNVLPWMAAENLSASCWSAKPANAYPRDCPDRGLQGTNKYSNVPEKPEFSTSPMMSLVLILLGRFCITTLTCVAPIVVGRGVPSPALQGNATEAWFAYGACEVTLARPDLATLTSSARANICQSCWRAPHWPSEGCT